MQLDVSDLARRAATSLRAISRMFPVETGLTFKAQRQRARIALAIDQLSAERAIWQVAADVGFGFGSTAAFSFALPTSNANDTTAFLHSLPLSRQHEEAVEHLSGLQRGGSAAGLRSDGA